MKISPFLEQIYQLVAKFLAKSGHKDLSDALKKHYQLPSWVERQNPLLQKGLIKIIKDYVKSQQKYIAYYKNRKEQSQSQHQEQVVQPQIKTKKQKKQLKSQSPKAIQRINIQTRKSPRINIVNVNNKNNSSWMSKFQQPKRLEDINGQMVEVQKSPKKQQKIKKQKKKVEVSSSDYESQQDSFQLQPKKKSKKQIVSQKNLKKQSQQIKKVQKNKKNEVKQAKIIQQQQQQVKTNGNYKNNRNPIKFFSRIDPNEIGPIKAQLKDNSFQAKAKYGQAADDWGKFGHQKLKDTRGDSFKKTKGKLKNRAFQGNLMDMNKINSIPIL